jgi:uncharacterized protein involved in type VI secretion and phage assembly
MSDSEITRVLEALASRHFGKYRGEVTGNDDPLGQGRIEVRVPAILGERTLWAMPCVPYAGPDVGFLALPPVGAKVWVEFEAGDRAHPIWVGGYWDPDQLPAEAAPTTLLLKTPGATLRVQHDGTVEIETSAGTRATLAGDEIRLEAPSIKQSANGGSTEVSASGFDAQHGAFKVG